jgi:hypothetical protein
MNFGSLPRTPRAMTLLPGGLIGNLHTRKNFFFFDEKQKKLDKVTRKCFSALRDNQPSVCALGSRYRRPKPTKLLRYKLPSQNWATLLPVINPECSGGQRTGRGRRLVLQCVLRISSTEAEKKVRTPRSTGNDTQQFVKVFLFTDCDVKCLVQDKMITKETWKCAILI